MILTIVAKPENKHNKIILQRQKEEDEKMITTVT
jgi:hypothetical protein